MSDNVYSEFERTAKYNGAMFQRFAIWLKVLFPLILLIGLNVWPTSRMVDQLMARVRGEEIAGRHEKIVGMLSKLASMQPYRHLEEKLAFAYATVGDYKSAQNLYEWVDQHSGLSAAGLESWANMLEQMGRKEEAIRLWKRIASMSVTAEPFQRSAILLRNSGNFSAAEEAVREWQARSPEDAKAAYWLGLLTAADSPDEARKWIDLAAILDQQYLPGGQSFRLAHGQSGLNNNLSYQYTVMGRWLGGQNAWDLAEIAFNNAVEISPEYAEAWAFLGQSRSQLYQKGGNEFKKAVEINPKSVLARALLASFYSVHGEIDQAIVQMEAAHKLEPKRALWLVELGNFTAKNGNLPEAKVLFLQAQHLEPENPLVWDAAARFSLIYGVDLREFGLLAARSLISLRPDEAAGYDLEGSIMMGLGDLRSAERFLHHALEMQIDFAPAHYHLGEVYLQLSEMDRADYHLSRAVELDRNGDTAKAARRLLEKYFGKG